MKLHWGLVQRVRRLYTSDEKTSNTFCLHEVRKYVDTRCS